MDRHDSVDCGRRALLGALGVMILSAVLRPARALAQETSGAKMPIGVVGSGVLDAGNAGYFSWSATLSTPAFVLAQRAKNAGQARRLLAIAAVLDGSTREEAARVGGMDRQTLRDWVIRFNEQGPEGLINIPSPGAPAKLNAEHKAFLTRIVRRGPDACYPWRRALAGLRPDLAPA